MRAGEKVQRGGYAGAGPSAQGAFSSGGHPRSRTACSVTPEHSPQGKQQQCVLLPARQLKNLFSELFTN